MQNLQNLKGVQKRKYMGKSTKSQILTAWKNLGRNLTQKSRFKKEITKKAVTEADKIADKAEKSKGWISSEPIPKISTYSIDPSKLSKEELKKIHSRRRIRKQVVKARKRQAKQKGII